MFPENDETLRKFKDCSGNCAVSPHIPKIFAIVTSRITDVPEKRTALVLARNFSLTSGESRPASRKGRDFVLFMAIPRPKGQVLKFFVQWGAAAPSPPLNSPLSETTPLRKSPCSFYLVSRVARQRLKTEKPKHNTVAMISVSTRTNALDLTHPLSGKNVVSAKNS